MFAILFHIYFVVTFGMLQHIMNCCITITSNVTTVTEVRSVSARLFAGTWRPLVSVTTTVYYVAKIIFHRRVRYCALSLRYARILRSGIILIP